MKYLILILLFIACTGPKYNKADPNQTYVSSGVAKFLLPRTPTWANFSTEGQCFRKSPVTFLDYANLSSNYNLDYDQLVNFQLMFNLEVEKKKKQNKTLALSPSQEEVLFFDVSKKIQNNVKSFKAPRYNKINLVWVDHIFENKRRVARLKKLLDSGVGRTAHPVFVSYCLSNNELQYFVKRHKFSNLDVRLIGSEMFSVYGQSLVQKTYFGLEIDTILKGKDITVFSPLAKSPKSLSKYKITNY